MAGSNDRGPPSPFGTSSLCDLGPLPIHQCETAPMSRLCLLHAIRNYSAPAIWVSAVCLVFGLVFLTRQPGAATAFLLAAAGAMGTFMLLAARQHHCRPETGDSAQ